MPDITTRLGLKKPLGNETVSRAAYNENLDILDEVVAKEADLAAHLADYVKQVPYGVATGTANTYAVTLDPAPTAYVEGMAVAVKINVDNTGPSTINVNGLGAKAIKKPNGNDVSAGNLKAGSIYTLRYNGVNFILQGEMGVGNAQPSDVLSGKTFTNDQGEQTGTMPNNGAVVITPSTVNKVIPAGYHNGAGYVVGDANLVASNIRSGVSIFGVSGTLVPKFEASGSINCARDTVYTISGLSFTPVLVFIKFSYYDSIAGQSLNDFTAKGAINGVQLPPNVCDYYVEYYSPHPDGSSPTSSFRGNGPSQITFTSNGFTFRSAYSHGSAGNLTYYWAALG